MKPALTLSMIVRNGEHDLPRCLESAAGVVDEIIIADTGSTDSSMDVARRYGAQVIQFPWNGDFARARNQALEPVRTDWVLMLDADEMLGPEAATRIPLLLENQNAGGYQVSIRNYVASLQERVWDRLATPNESPLPTTQAYPAYVDHENVRLFRRHPDIYFVGCVHETVGPRIVETGRGLGRADFLIHHFGLVAAPETRARKNLLYRELGRRKVQEMPHDAQAHFELGLVELDNFHNDEEALSYFERACQLNPRLGVAWFFAGVTYARLGQHAEALDCLQRAGGPATTSGAVAEAQGDAHYNLEQFEEAVHSYRRALKRAATPALESKLGLAEARMGRVAAGLARLQKAVAKEPDQAELHDRLITACVWTGRLEEAAAAAENKLGAAAPHPDSFLRAASIRAQMQHWQRAAELLRTGLALFPSAEKLQRGLSEVEPHLEHAAEKMSNFMTTGINKGFPGNADSAS